MLSRVLLCRSFRRQSRSFLAIKTTNRSSISANTMDASGNHLSGNFQKSEDFWKARKLCFGKDGFLLFANILADLGHYDHVIKILSDMDERGISPPVNNTIYVEIISKLTIGIPFSKVAKIIEPKLTQNTAESDILLSSVIKSLSKSFRIDTAVEIFRNLEDSGYVPSTLLYVTFLKEILRHYKLGIAREIQAKIDGKESTAATSTKTFPIILQNFYLMHGFILRKKMAEAMEIALSENVSQNQNSLYDFIFLLGSYGHVGELLKIFKILKGKNMLNDAILEHLILSLGKTDKPNLAVQIFHEYCENRHENGIRTVLLSNMISITGKLNFHESLKFFYSVQDKYKISYTVDFFAKILSVCLVHNKFTEAWKIFSEMKTKYFVRPNLRCYEVIFKLLSKTGEFIVFEEILSQMKSDNIALTLGISNSIIEFYGNNGKIEKAKEFFEQITRNSISGGITDEFFDEQYGFVGAASVYASMAKILSSAGQKTKALEILQQMELHNISPNEYSLSVLEAILAQKNPQK